MNWLLTGEISGGIIAGMWIVAYAIAGLRRLISGPFVPEVINEAFYAKYAAQAATHTWPYRILTAFDILVNVIFRGQADETLSGRAYRASLEKKIWGIVLSYWLDLLQEQHGPKAAVGDIWRAYNRIATNKQALGLLCEQPENIRGE